MLLDATRVAALSEPSLLPKERLDLRVVRVDLTNGRREIHLEMVPDLLREKVIPKLGRVEAIRSFDDVCGVATLVDPLLNESLPVRREILHLEILIFDTRCDDGLILVVQSLCPSSCDITQGGI